MKIERVNNEIVFTLPADTDILSLQKIINYFRYKEATTQSKASEEDANILANESKANWWLENKHKFIK